MSIPSELPPTLPSTQSSPPEAARPAAAKAAPAPAAGQPAPTARQSAAATAPLPPIAPGALTNVDNPRPAPIAPCKVYTRAPGRIDPDKVAALGRSASPGDPIFERLDSGPIAQFFNVVVPGYWSHVKVYVGSQEKIRSYFDSDPETLALVAQLVHEQPQKLAGVTTFSGLLARAFPDLWASFSTPEAAHGLVLEANDHGVSLSSFDTAISDHIAMVGLEQPKVDRARALLRGFLYHGRPYDVQVRMDDDSALTCAELFFRMWEPEPRGDLRTNDLTKEPMKQGVALSVFSKFLGNPNVTPDDVIKHLVKHWQTGGFKFLGLIEPDSKGAPDSPAAFSAFRRSPMRDVDRVKIESPP